MTTEPHRIPQGADGSRGFDFPHCGPNRTDIYNRRARETRQIGRSFRFARGPNKRYKHRPEKMVTRTAVRFGIGKFLGDDRVGPMSLLSNDQDCFQASQSRPMYDSFTSIARVANRSSRCPSRRCESDKKASSFTRLRGIAELNYLPDPIFFGEFLW